MAEKSKDLSVESKSIERLYREYLQGDYLANRKYQRKLVWLVDEKRNLIDSILKKYPLPQFLLAESSDPEDGKFEIIDGMQRMNAIVSFIENEYDLDGKYFLIDTLSSAKQLLDEGELIQREPALSREESVAIANYQLAFSVYGSRDGSNVEEVFRRINSSGRMLSGQDLRQAGADSPVAEVVNEIATQIRGDMTSQSLVPMSEMAKISISSDESANGIDVDELLWVQQGILNKAGVRSSADEELILDILADMIFDLQLPTSPEIRNALYRADRSKPSKEDLHKIEKALDTPDWDRGKKEDLVTQFMETMTRVESIFRELGKQGTTFKKQVSSPNNPVPRYFQTFFSAVYKLLYVDKKDLSHPEKVPSILRHTERKGSRKGGTWPSAAKIADVNHWKERLEIAFDQTFDPDSEGIADNYLPRAKFQRLLTGSFQQTESGRTSESSGRELKQGFLNLAPAKSGVSRDLENGPFLKIMKTLTAISNTHPKVGGHIIVGVADKDEDAKRILELDGVDSKEWKGFHIVGLGREADHLGISFEEYAHRIVSKIYNCQQLPQAYRHKVASEVKLASLGEDFNLLVLPAPPVSDAQIWDDKEYYHRVHSQVEKVEDLVKFGMEFTQRL